MPLVGVSKAGDGFDLAELMEFVGKAYNSPNADVRSEAVRVTKEVHDLVGPAIRCGRVRAGGVVGARGCCGMLVPCVWKGSGGSGLGLGSAFNWAQ